MTRYAAITGWGMAVPEQVLTNADLEKMVDTSDEWIRTRTGIIERRIAGPEEHTSTLATSAGRSAMERAGVSPDEVDLVIVATCTPDCPIPSTACAVQARLGLHRAGAFDVVAACSGFVYGMSVATSMIRGGGHQTILLIAADLLTRAVNWKDRNTCILFGDGAGAVVLQATEEPFGLLSSVLRSDGEHEGLMIVEAGGTRLPITHDLIEEDRHCVVMQGREVFKYAVRGLVESSHQAIADAGLTMDDIRLVVPHQANFRIIDALIKRLELPPERVVVNIERYGNTSGASVPIALNEAAEAGRLHKGDYVLLTAFGAGFAWASAVVRWGH